MERLRQVPGEVVVEVRASGPGDGFSGVVIEGDGGPGLAVGDQVFGATPAEHGAGTLVVCHRRALEHKPAALAHAEAAVLAGAGPAALWATRLAGASPRARVMVAGAGGDAGALAVQIAKVRGSHVTAVCCDRDVPLAWDLGADDVQARDRDAGESGRFGAVIDTDQSVTREIAEQLLEPDGRLVAVRDGAIHVSTPGGEPICVQLLGAADEADLRELAELVEHAGVFPVPR